MVTMTLETPVDVREPSSQEHRADLPLTEPTRLYRQEVKQVSSLLSREEVTRLTEHIARTKSGEKRHKRLEEMSQETQKAQEAKQRLIEANLRLVLHIARKYKRFGIDFLDLVQEGNLGLMHAVEKFDHRKGYRFSTYATWWIRQYITRALVEKAHTIYIPYHKMAEIKRLSRIWRELEQKLENEPTLEDLAVQMDVSVEQVVELLSTNQGTLSLDQARSREENDESTLADDIEDDPKYSPEKIILHQSLREQLLTLLAMLPEDEYQVLLLRYGLGNRTTPTLANVLGYEGNEVDEGRSHSLTETGQILGLSHEAVRQKEFRALRRLAPYCVHYHLEAYLES